MREVFTKRINNLFVFLDFAIYNCRRGGRERWQKSGRQKNAKSVSTRRFQYILKSGDWNERLHICSRSADSASRRYIREQGGNKKPGKQPKKNGGFYSKGADAALGKTAADDFISIWFYRRERTYAGGNRSVARYWAKGSRADGSARASDSAKPAVLQRAEKSAFSAVMHRFCRTEQDIINI